MSKYITLILLFLSQFLSAQLVTLSADGPGDTYDLISSALAPGANPIEVPDCGHTSFGEHIDELFDADLNANVFRFFMHVAEDDDRCINFDRQRNEIKTYASSPDHLKGIEDEVVEYKWKFKLDAGFQSSPKFTHIHQLKAVGGSEASHPIITLTTRKGSPDELELRHGETTSSVKLLETDLAPFLGVWCEAIELVTYGENGTYAITIKKVSDQTTLLTYSNSDIRMWRTDTDFVRPKWGIYRSLEFEDDLRDEEVLFNDFSIEELGSLPVDLVSFTAKPLDNRIVELNWQTASEENNKGFEIEKSMNGQDFVLLDFVKAAPSSSTTNNYQYLDKTPFSGKIYYRLKQVDLDHSFEYSEVAVVQIPKTDEAILLRPNPTNGLINIIGLGQNSLIEIYNDTGLKVSEGYTKQGQLDLSALPGGVYFLRFYDADGFVVRRMLKW